MWRPRAQQVLPPVPPSPVPSTLPLQVLPTLDTWGRFLRVLIKLLTLINLCHYILLQSLKTQSSKPMLKSHCFTVQLRCRERDGHSNLPFVREGGPIQAFPKRMKFRSWIAKMTQKMWTSDSKSSVLSHNFTSLSLSFHSGVLIMHWVTAGVDHVEKGATHSPSFGFRPVGEMVKGRQNENVMCHMEVFPPACGSIQEEFISQTPRNQGRLPERR